MGIAAPAGSIRVEDDVRTVGIFISIRAPGAAVGVRGKTGVEEETTGGGGNAGLVPLASPAGTGVGDADLPGDGHSIGDVGSISDGH